MKTTTPAAEQVRRRQRQRRATSAEMADAHQKELKQLQAPTTSDLPWALGQNGDKCARNHAICSGPRVIAKVLGTGYPIGEGWSPRSEADAQLIVTAVNHHEVLVAALRDELEAIRVWQSAPGIPAEVRDGLQISTAKINAALASVRQTAVK